VNDRSCGNPDLHWNPGNGKLSSQTRRLVDSYINNRLTSGNDPLVLLGKMDVCHSQQIASDTAEPPDEKGIYDDARMQALYTPVALFMFLLASVAQIATVLYIFTGGIFENIVDVDPPCGSYYTCLD
jgi:hypothetical protein